MRLCLAGHLKAWISLLAVGVASPACHDDEGRRPDAGADAGSIDGPSTDLPAESRLPSCDDPGPAIDVNTLLDEMTDLGSLARRSLVPFRTYEASSYDRRSAVPAVSGEEDDGWYANVDWGNFSGVQRTRPRVEYVMVDAEGPGAIVRIWSATPRGLLRIYLDDLSTPVITAELAEILRGEHPSFPPPFSVVNASGANLDFPLPFRRRARVTVEGDGPALFYQVFVRRYAPCANVVTYAPGSVLAEKLALVARRLMQPELPSDAVSAEATLNESKSTFQIQAAAGGSDVVALIAHPSITTAAALRASVLTMRFDGRETVRAPVGDFFGAGPGLIAHRSLPLEVSRDGVFVSRFSMPFARVMEIALAAKDGLTLDIRIAHRARKFDGGTYHFHAQWNARGPMASRPFRDLTLADLDGEGAYVGTMLAFGNGGDAWWGEGDEKIWIDDDRFPSLFGTGTEDYFGYAYSSRELFDHPYRLQSLAGLPMSAGDDWRGLVSNARFHVLDVLRFDERLKFDMELWHWGTTAVTYDTIVYFYASPGATNRVPSAAPTEFRLSPIPMP